MSIEDEGKLERELCAGDFGRVSEESDKQAKLLKLAGAVINVALRNFLTEEIRPGYPIGVQVAEQIHSNRSNSLDEVLRIRAQVEEARDLIDELTQSEHAISIDAAETRDQVLAD